MADYIGCRKCDSHDCKGCNLKNLETMLNNGKFDCLMDGNRCINPSADVAQVRHGRWDSSGKYRFQIDNSVAVRCTECGCSLTEQEYRGNVWNYCPVCGANMDGDD